MFCPVCVGVLLSLQTTAAASLKETLSDCLNDTDYSELLQTLRTGLPHINKSHRVAVVGAGAAGLTAAKLLQDAGHKVQTGSLSSNH